MNETTDILTRDEPVGLVASITAAVTSTIALLALLGVPGEVVAAISLAATGWIGVGAAWARRRVTPNHRATVSGTARATSATRPRATRV